MGDAQKIGKTDTYETIRGEATKVGCLMSTPHGEVDVLDAPGFSTLLIKHEDNAMSRVGMLVYDPDIRTGMIAQLDADAARTVAASLMRLANQLDEMRPN
jgi:hypothetical protein